MRSTCASVVSFFLALTCAAVTQVLPPETSWQQMTWNGNASYSIDSTGGRDGSPCVVIESTSGADASWYTVMPVEPWATYRLTGWIRTENLDPGSGRGALLNLHDRQGIQTSALTGTEAWREVAVEFETSDQGEVWINCLFGGWGQSTGKAWFDDIRLEQVAKTELKPHGTIHLQQTKPPISKYIYGQFIEHLGRCIYGGIWAEMLEDRKFFASPGDDASPWLIEGPVEIVEAETYKGGHMPRLKAGAMLRQGGISLKKNTHYEGYVLARSAASGTGLDVTLAWPGNESTSVVDEINSAWKKYPFRFYAGADSHEGRLSFAANGDGTVEIGAISLMPADNVRGMRADALELLKQLDAPVYRWPGGNFVSGYDWRDGIGERDRRPPRKNPAWSGIEHNDFGLDEFMAFCTEIGTEPYVVVNSGEGDIEMALAELEYCNGAADTQWGKIRAANGHPEPYGVKWWGVGNEMYGDWQLGHMPLDQYVQKHNRFAQAMTARDPGIEIIGVGATGAWSERMLSECADNLSLLSEHFYCGEQASVYAHVAQVPRNIEMKVRAHQQYHETIPSLAGKHIPICMDEWNYWYGDHVYGELGTRYYLKDALGIAAGLHAYYDASEWVFMANYAQTVNVIGCIKTTPTDAAFDTTGLVLKLYRAQYGTRPVAFEGDSRPLFVAAALTEKGDAVTVSIVNPMPAPQNLPLAFAGGDIRPGGTHWTITAEDPLAFNTPGKLPAVSVGELPAPDVTRPLDIAPFSINLYRLPLEK